MLGRSVLELGLTLAATDADYFRVGDHLFSIDLFAAYRADLVDGL